MTEATPTSLFAFVDRDTATRKTVKAHFEEGALNVRVISSLREAKRAIGDPSLSALVTDLDLGGRRVGLDLCAYAHARNPELPVIVTGVSGRGKVRSDVLAAGAWDVLPKPLDLAQLANSVQRAVEHRELKNEVQRLRSLTAEVPDAMVGESAAMGRVHDLIDRVGRTGVSVLITAETGCGKELAAKAIHRVSSRRDGPFVPVNVAAIPETLLESELFGHKKGAFTGAISDHQGLFEQASGGTLFLDEIGEMPAAMQVKLLRALEESRVRPVGSTRTVRFDARIVAATNRDLEAEIATGAFREDLYYRLNVVRLTIPPLRDRGNDVLLLAQHFVKEFGSKHGIAMEGLDAAASEALLDHPWPGNVRELRNAIERAVALAQNNVVTLGDLPRRVRESAASVVPAPALAPPPQASLSMPSDAIITLAELEKRYILEVLARLQFNRSSVAEVLGIDRKTLYRKLKKWEAEGVAVKEQ